MIPPVWDQQTYVQKADSFWGAVGDFDLLLGAVKQNLKIMDIPIRYKKRFYGETNIQRWRSGVILSWIVIFAARRLKFV